MQVLQELQVREVLTVLGAAGCCGDRVLHVLIVREVLKVLGSRAVTRAVRARSW